MARATISAKEKEEILIRVASVITESLRNEGKLPSGEVLQNELKQLASNEKFKKSSFSPSDVSRFRAEVLEKYIDFSRTSVKSAVDSILSQEFEEKFHLRKAIVLDNTHIRASGLSLNNYLGKKTAEYLTEEFNSTFSESIQKNFSTKTWKYIESKIPKEYLNTAVGCDKITFSCGSTVGAAIDHLNEDLKNTTAYSSIVLIISSFVGISPSELIHKFTYKFNSKGFTFQLPKEILNFLSGFDKNKSIAQDDELRQRSYFYNGVIKPTLEKVLDAEYLVLGVGGVPTDKHAGGFSHLVNVTNCWEEFSKYCSGELGFWPILRNKEKIIKDGTEIETIWLWDYVRNKQEKHMDKGREIDFRDQPAEEAIFSRFKNFFWQTYTANFNALIRKQKIQVDFTRKLNKLIEDNHHDHINQLVDSTLVALERKKCDQNSNDALYRALRQTQKRKTIIPAGGPGKARAIYHCLSYKTKFIDTLIVDRETARDILLLHEG